MKKKKYALKKCSSWEMIWNKISIQYSKRDVKKSHRNEFQRKLDVSSCDMSMEKKPTKTQPHETLQKKDD